MNQICIYFVNKFKYNIQYTIYIIYIQYKYSNNMIIVSWNINNDYRDIDDKIHMIIELLNTKNIDMFGIQEVIPELYDKLYTRISKKLGFASHFIQPPYQ